MKKILAIAAIAVAIANVIAFGMLTNVVTQFAPGNFQPVEKAATVPAPAQDGVVGLWGGKWDDTWPVFLLIETNAEPNTYTVHYKWLENFSDANFSERKLIGYKTNNYVHARFLDFRMTASSGILYGEFKAPRMANLVRLGVINNPSAQNADDLLRTYSWTEKAIPAAEAFAEITKP